jgi:acetyl-CoA carboxylase biotin carboxyl carrier protein
LAKRKTNNNSTKPGAGAGAGAGTSATAGRNATRHQSPMDVELLERLVKLMASNDLNTVDLRDGEQRVVLKRGAFVAPNPSSGFFAHPAPTAYAPSHASPPGLVSGTTSAPPSTPPGAGESDRDLVAIKSPMVGTFYSSPSPDAKPFVSVGSQVDEETDVCIIEAMKVFNNIKAECRGTIAKALVNNGQTVEFGQVLFLVKPS